MASRKRSGKSKQNAIDIEADMDNGYMMLGYVSGLSTEVKTDRYIGSVITYAHDRMAQHFDENIDQVARGNDANFSHVYENRMLGVPQGRLWQHQLSGRGAARQATWKWLPSTQPILTPEERKAAHNPNDPISEVDDADLERLSGRDYYFTWKAPVMEYGLTVNIVAKNAKALFIPTFGVDNGFIFRKSSNNQMQNKGAGRFSGFWAQWWSSSAPALWDAEIKRTIEKDLGRSSKELSRKGRKTTKTFNVSTIGNADAAFEAGRNYAEAYVKGKAKSYAQASKYIDRYGKYGSEVNYPT